MAKRRFPSQTCTGCGSETMIDLWPPSSGPRCRMASNPSARASWATGSPSFTLPMIPHIALFPGRVGVSRHRFVEHFRGADAAGGCPGLVPLQFPQLRADEFLEDRVHHAKTKAVNAIEETR